MEKLFVPYELAIKLKEKGFDERCFMWWYSPTQMSADLIFRQYKNDKDFCEAPIYQQVTDWLRDKHDINIVVVPSVDVKKNYRSSVYKQYGIKMIQTNMTEDTTSLFNYPNYYTAFDKAIKYALTII